MNNIQLENDLCKRYCSRRTALEFLTNRSKSVVDPVEVIGFVEKYEILGFAFVEEKFCLAKKVVEQSYIRTVSVFIGITACLVSGLFFGSRFAAIKGYNAGDGHIPTIPIIHRIGMLIGFLLRNSTKYLTGWATGN
ncbi:hypothetical protein KIN20_012695 [Parelaphostrongylus tenuis]|uniref:Uncharacterized protein n=1 Tax=Parelaphostrongylus tenuis TaxID=148309 RepID=A0AAD5QQL4_PARTN|nr:hypothetical protein KIN20_012695 [Parelaphostrongylus tenuis]